MTRSPSSPLRRALLCGVAMFAAAHPFGSVSAQAAWPTKPITYVVPYPPGGTTDLLGRAITERLGRTLGATVIVDNRAGATGTIGGAFVARAAPDGYTLLGTSIGPQAIAPHLMARLPYDAAKAYEPVTLVGTVPHVLVVNAASRFQSVDELIAAARQKPGGVAFASGGNGTILQMQGELLRLQTRTEMTHVPYKGDVPALQDVIGGQVDFMFAPVAAALQQVQSGRLRALAVTSANRLAALPTVPTMAEAGVKDFVVEQWQAIYAPAGTPPAIVERLQAEIVHILKTPDVAASLDKLGVIVVGSSGAELARRQAADSARWAAVIRDAGIKLD